MLEDIIEPFRASTQTSNYFKGTFPSMKANWMRSLNFFTCTKNFFDDCDLFLSGSEPSFLSRFKSKLFKFPGIVASFGSSSWYEPFLKYYCRCGPSSLSRESALMQGTGSFCYNLKAKVSHQVPPNLSGRGWVMLFFYNSYCTSCDYYFGNKKNSMIWTSSFFNIGSRLIFLKWKYHTNYTLTGTHQARIGTWKIQL